MEKETAEEFFLVEFQTRSKASLLQRTEAGPLLSIHSEPHTQASTTAPYNQSCGTFLSVFLNLTRCLAQSMCSINIC